MMLCGRVVVCAFLWLTMIAFGVELAAFGGDGPEGPSLSTPFVATRPVHLPIAMMLAQQPPQQTDEFVPIDQLPPQDQLPAAPLLVAAYSFVVVALFFYLVSVARRLARVQRELTRLEADLKRGGQR